MAFGDIGGVVSELVITCKTKASGTVAIAKGDAVKLTGNYEIDNATDDEDVVFGEAMADVANNGAAVPIKVRGVAVFTYNGAAPTVDGVAGIAASATDGEVKAPASGNGQGVNLRVDTANNRVHVLL